MVTLPCAGPPSVIEFNSNEEKRLKKDHCIVLSLRTTLTENVARFKKDTQNAFKQYKQVG